MTMFAMIVSVAASRLAFGGLDMIQDNLSISTVNNVVE